MRSACWLVAVVLAVGMLSTGCISDYVKVTDTKVIKAGQPFTVYAPANRPAVAMKVSVDLGVLDLTKEAKATAQAQGISLPNLDLKGACWLVVGADTNAAAK